MANTGVIYGSVAVGTTPYRMESFPLETPQVPESGGPSWLLAARYEVVPFTSRSGELDTLGAWRDQPQRSRMVQLIYGSGGQGKTRLAAAFARASAKLGWQVIAVCHNGATGPLAPPIEPTPADRERMQGRLLIVDYAERWPTRDLISALTDQVSCPPASAVRVLLLSRSADYWWQGLRHELNKSGVQADEMALGPLSDDRAGREAEFARAAHAFADLLGVGDTDHLCPPQMEGDEWRLVLTIHMAALAAVDACQRNEIPPANQAGLSAYLLDRETAYWSGLYSDRRVCTLPVVLGRAVYISILTRALPFARAVNVLDHLGIDAASQVVDDHRICYPPTDPATALEPLYPDLLAEDFLALTTPGHQVAAHSADPWAARIPAQLVGSREPSDQGPDYRPSAVAILVETARRWPHVAQTQLNPLLLKHPELAIAAGSSTLIRIAETLHVDMTVLEAIEALLPPGRHVGLDVAAAALATRLTKHRIAAIDDDGERARLHARLGWRLANAGLQQEAAASYARAIATYKRLADTDAAVFATNFASVLVNFSHVLSDLGQRQRALDAASEAVGIIQRLTASNPAAFDTDIAASTLYALGDRLGENGRQEEGLGYAAEAARFYRHLAASNPIKFESKLAAALTGLASTLAILGRCEDARAAGAEAVEVYRRLAASNPAEFTPDLAGAVTSLSATLSASELYEEALPAAREAVEIYRYLAASNPARFEPKLASALNNLGAALSDLFRTDEALAATAEALELRRRLAASNPAAFDPELALALNNLSVDFSNLGRREEALAATAEAVAIYRRIANANPSAFDADLARALANMSADLLHARRTTAALDAAAEAVEIYRRLSGSNPHAFSAGLARALANLAASFSELGRKGEARAAAAEAVDLRRRL
ncbi:tetratricopeptide repeat protein [Micromonospora sp. NPDC049751]|uniref:tetratricopeptide repeat protein n=1 Tax=Micromonospora sp. NPDC049751 TaxID=3154837 RepID=UPI0033E85D61